MEVFQVTNEKDKHILLSNKFNVINLTMIHYVINNLRSINNNENYCNYS